MEKNVCWIVGAGDFCAKAFTPREEEYVIAADGGYAPLMEMGAEVHMVLGDFDSLGYMPEHRNVVRHKPEKDDTDMMLAVKEGLRRGYGRFAMLGALGGRLDHTLANIQTLMYISRRNCRGFLIGEESVVTAITDSELFFSAQHRGVVSVFCLAEPAHGVTLRGLKYPLDRVTLESSVALGVSNEFTGQPSSVAVEKGTLVITWRGGELERMLRS